MASIWVTWCSYVENSLELRILQPSGKNRRHHYLTQGVAAMLFTPVPFQNVWNCRFPKKRSYSGVEEDVSFIRDRFTTWVKADSNTTLEGHVVDVRKALVEYREASSRSDDTPAQERGMSVPSLVEVREVTQHGPRRTWVHRERRVPDRSELFFPAFDIWRYIPQCETHVVNQLEEQSWRTLFHHSQIVHR